MSALSRERLADVFVEVAGDLVGDFDLVALLQRLATHVAELVDAAEAGVLLVDGEGHLQFMAASDESSRKLELHQLQHAQGPCLDAFTTRTAVVNADLTSTSEWPVFTARAVAAGIRSVHAIPLRLRGDVIGAMGLFATGTGHLPPQDVRVVQALADVATIAILQERAIRRAEVLTEQLQGALDSRTTIEQAKGVLSRVHGVDVDRAFTILRDFCRPRGLRITDVARAVVTAPHDVPGLTTGLAP